MADLAPADGLVGGVVQVLRVGAGGEAALGGRAGVLRVLLVGHHGGQQAHSAGLLEGLGAPLTSQHVICRVAGRRQVERHGGELPHPATLQEEHFVVAGDLHQFTQRPFGLGSAGDEVGTAMRDLHHRHAALPIGQLGLGLLNDLERHHCGTGGEVVNAHEPDCVTSARNCGAQSSPGRRTGPTRLGRACSMPSANVGQLRR